ncbi:MAG: putative molybdenum carrier protein [Bacteroidales bacterium]|nr:putative molybdenum carrier protein [Bacteroidales bacterium]
MLKIISGGQTGVDRAALDFALKNGVNCGGWCPLGRKAEDGIISEKYPLLETKSSKYSERTKLNVKNSDGTLLIFDKILDKGSILTKNMADEYHKSIFLYDLSANIESSEIKKWMHSNKINVLNIAGPRESNSIGIYLKTYKLLSEIFILKKD